MQTRPLSALAALIAVGMSGCKTPQGISRDQERQALEEWAQYYIDNGGWVSEPLTDLEALHQAEDAAFVRKFFEQNP